MSNAITRDQAIETLCDLIDSGILSEEIEGKLAEIMNAVENEKYGLHLWGADNEEYDALCTSVREDLLNDEYRNKVQGIYNKYAFLPSQFEATEIEESLEGNDE